MMSPQIKQTAVNPRTIAVNSRTTIVVKGNTTHNDGYETPLKEVVAEQQEHPSLKTAQHQQANGQPAERPRARVTRDNHLLDAR